MTLCLLSFNIRYGGAPDGENRWDLRKERAIERIRSAAPDLLGVQECQAGAQADFLQAQLPEYAFFGVRRGGNAAADEMAPILYRRAAFVELARGCFWLSETPETPGSLGWDALFARTAQWVRLQPKGAAWNFLFVNTHFDYQPLATRMAAGLLRQRLAALTAGGAALLCGDFNACPGSPAHQQLTGDGALRDVVETLHPGAPRQPTFHGYGQAATFEAIDWILASPHFRPIAASVDDTHAGSLYPSDHYPLLASLAWADPANGGSPNGPGTPFQP